MSVTIKGFKLCELQVARGLDEPALRAACEGTARAIPLLDRSGKEPRVIGVVENIRYVDGAAYGDVTFANINAEILTGDNRRFMAMSVSV